MFYGSKKTFTSSSFGIGAELSSVNVIFKLIAERKVIKIGVKIANIY